VPNPFFGLPEFTGTGLSGVNAGVAQLLRPYPHFGDILVSFPAGYSYYHSLQAGVEKRMSHGFTLQSAWTWSKFMDGAGYLNETNDRTEKVISDQDFTHRFAISGIYELPFGRGRKWFASMPRAADYVFGGWQLQAWYEGQTGAPLGFGNAIFTAISPISNFPITSAPTSVGSMWMRASTATTSSNSSITSEPFFRGSMACAAMGSITRISPRSKRSG
jgi:hypothetical protein